MVTINKKHAIRSAKERVLRFLEQDDDVRGTGAFYQYPGEEAYILEAFVPQKNELSFLKRIEPLLNEIADTNDFTILVIPLPPPVTTTTV